MTRKRWSTRVGTVAAILTIFALLSQSAVATPGICWYLSSGPHDPLSFDGLEDALAPMTQDVSHVPPIGWVLIPDGESHTWVSEEAAEVDFNFGTGLWRMRCEPESTGAPGADAVKGELGEFFPDGTFVVADDVFGSIFDHCTHLQGLTFKPKTDFIVHTGNYLAVRITDKADGTDSNITVTGGQHNGSQDSKLCGPDGVTGYPFPEVASLLMVASGVLIMAGLAGVRRSRRKRE